MAFDFIVNTPRKEYKNTFLQSVFLSIHFDKIDQTSVSCNFNENWEKYIRTTFNNLEPRSNERARRPRGFWQAGSYNRPKIRQHRRESAKAHGRHRPRQRERGGAPAPHRR